ncbi:hypothetical protein JJB11_21505 [Ramlibacter ginsenosidimutans]|uniref:DUF1311 domain-containing protein n=1 Tax=Ramlibacter ginsenosidimutans TaxID=502333 RepID=A0A934TX19_9BURK|nr:hypothetical protein [Ramlibacter ginsenosidimutans]MBK6008686.1 hypothetical protein [Ramlibacter ginsenosidimutans]
MRALLVSLVAVLGSLAASSFAQSELDRAKNLAMCLEGRYPSLCKRSWLTSQELPKVEAAERRENLKTCMSGRYASLCKREWLSPNESREVLLAERRENLKTCMSGRFKSLCKKSLLTQAELTQVLAAEAAENLKTCLSGRYPSLCDRALLSPQQLAQAQEAERSAAAARPQQSRRSSSGLAGRSGYGGCEDGHWIESVLSDGSIVKLEDGSVWEVDGADSVDSALWLPVSEIVACDNKLINTDDNESVSAHRIR